MTAIQDPAQKLRAFGLTHAQNKAIQQNQIDKTVKMIPANNAEHFQDQYFEKEYKGYQIAEHDAIHFHVAQESRTFDQSEGRKLSKSMVQMYDVPTFKALMDMKPVSGFHGKVIHILHDPRKESKKPVAPEKSAVVIPPGLPEFKSPKEAKDYYRKTFGKEPVRTWTLEKTIEAIQQETV